ncbi:hypothetical protein [Streptoalloteichus tenebrarius]|nr:hypothetical protein [Streptoalloteichus tenebrarius]
MGLLRLVLSGTPDRKRRRPRVRGLQGRRGGFVCAYATTGTGVRHP